MNYKNAIEILTRLEKFGIKLGLTKINQLLEYLGRPETQYPVIHIAGTNGKGSTAAILESILLETGFRVGLYTSPHLIHFAERIRVNRETISPIHLGEYIQSLYRMFQSLHPTFFEATTAIAFQYFLDQKVDIAIIETGLGGRLDSTNVVHPKVSIITDISYDHMDHLGFTLEQIAYEKCGIIKQNTPCITGVKNETALSVIRSTAKNMNSKLLNIHRDVKINITKLTSSGSKFECQTNDNSYPSLTINLAGIHQVTNAALSILALETLRIPGINPLQIRNGLKHVYWKARLENVSMNPLVVIDVAHNANSFEMLKFNLFLYKYRRLIGVLGLMADKQYQKICSIIVPSFDILVTVRPKTERALDPKILSFYASKYSDSYSFSSCEEGFQYARSIASKKDMILVAGSHFTAGEVLEKFYS